MKFSLLWEDLLSFSKCLKRYFRFRFKQAAVKFEIVKDQIVGILMAKRGVYSRPFLNMSLGILIAGGFLAVPVLAQNYPSAGSNLQNISPPSAIFGALTTATDQTSTVISDKPRDQIMVYQTQKGDTLGKIAEKFGVSVDSIKWASDLKSEKLSLGQELKIPPVTGVVYKVKPGDTIYSIAKYYKTDAQKIVNFPFNDFTDLDTFALAVGQTLIVPDGVMPEARAIVQTVPMIQTVGGTGELLWPAGGNITQYPVWYHNALDIANSSAPGIAAADSGKVILVEKQKYNYGWHVIIDHGNGLSTLYAHLQDIYVDSGQTISKGQIIGKMGSTGRSTGTHLHFEVRKNGTAVNPLSYLK